MKLAKDLQSYKDCSDAAASQRQVLERVEVEERSQSSLKLSRKSSIAEGLLLNDFLNSFLGWHRACLLLDARGRGDAE